VRFFYTPILNEYIMLDKKKTILMAAGLITLSIVLYTLHFLIFQDPQHIWIFLLSSLAFIPIEVLVFTLILDQLLEYRDRTIKLEKLNMVVGTFFSAMGTQLLVYFSNSDPHLQDMRKSFILSERWSDEEFAQVRRILSHYTCEINIEGIDLANLKAFLVEREDIMIRLLENPNLLEHERFTDLLQALFHLTEELEHRKDLFQLPENDRQHLAGDICRAYGHLIKQWLEYMQYLKKNYPYLFSLAMRRNPFDQDASPIIP
jgi:hypothetical protein